MGFHGKRRAFPVVVCGAPLVMSFLVRSETRLRAVLTIHFHARRYFMTSNHWSSLEERCVANASPSFSGSCAWNSSVRVCYR